MSYKPTFHVQWSTQNLLGLASLQWSGAKPAASRRHGYAHVYKELATSEHLLPETSSIHIKITVHTYTHHATCDVKLPDSLRPDDPAHRMHFSRQEPTVKGSPCTEHFY